jgi:transposase
VADGAELLFPLVKRLGELALASHVLQTDDIHLKVMDDRRKPAIKKGTLWCYIGDGQHVCFHYTPTREQKGPLAFLETREGWLQADGYSGYDKLYKGPDARIIEVGCWMHARRYFVKALEAGDLRAAWPIKQIKAMYEVEREATEQSASPEQRLTMRQERSLLVLNDLGKWIAETANTEVPGTPLDKALTYSVNQWQALNRYTEDGRLNIDNGAVERAIRAVAVGRKNYLFAGSDEGAERTAILYSVLGSCALADVNPWAYLRDVLMKLAGDWPYSRLDELLPAEWKRLYANTALPDAAAPLPPAPD